MTELRTLEEVTADLAKQKKRATGKNIGIDIDLAKLMLKHGRLTDEARAYVSTYLESDK